MNKKKVVELLKEALDYSNTTPLDVKTRVLCKDRAFRHIEEALSELKKSDWISFEDELPHYGEVVLVVCETYPNVIWSTKRMDRFENGRTLDEHLFNTKENIH